MGFIYITSFGGVEGRLLIACARNVKEVFGLESRLSSMQLPPPVGLDRVRRQYHVGDVLAYLRGMNFPGMVKLVGIVDADLYEEGKDFVFGGAEHGGPVAVVSTSRLKHMNERITFERILKEINHELGLTFGLKPCSAKGCVMGFSNSLKEVDSKSRYFCKACREELSRALSPYR